MTDVTTQQGIAFDIDDTLSDTLGYFIGQLRDKFGNPENLTVEEIIAKYIYTARVPYWQTPEIKQWLEEQFVLNEIQETIPVKGNALEIVAKIHEKIPVRMYITSRPYTVELGTKKWLKNKGFPEAEVITRPFSKQKIDGNAWKAAILESRYPEIQGIVDDNPEILGAFSPDYKGTVYLLGTHSSVPKTLFKVILCPTMDDVYRAITGKV